MSYDKILALSNVILKDVKTNVTSDEYLKIMASLFSDRESYVKNIISAQIPALTYSEGKNINGVYYYTTDLTKAKKDFIDYIFNK
ncbi:hypothetical protein D3C81_1911040 [compost metagenome]